MSWYKPRIFQWELQYIYSFLCYKTKCRIHSLDYHLSTPTRWMRVFLFEISLTNWIGGERIHHTPPPPYPTDDLLNLPKRPGKRLLFEFVKLHLYELWLISAILQKIYCAFWRKTARNLLLEAQLTAFLCPVPVCTAPGFARCSVVVRRLDCYCLACSSCAAYLVPGELSWG